MEPVLRKLGSEKEKGGPKCSFICRPVQVRCFTGILTEARVFKLLLANLDVSDSRKNLSILPLLQITGNDYAITTLRESLIACTN